MKTKRIISLLLCVILAFGGITGIAAESQETEFVINYQFDDMYSNDAPTGVTVNKGDVRSVDDGEKNKAMYIGEEYSEIVFNADGKKHPGTAIVSMDVKREGTGVLNMEVKTSGVVLFKVENNRITTSNGKQIANVYNNKYTNVAFAVNKKNYADIYIDGKLALRQWKLGSSLNDKLYITKATGAAAYIDNVYAYEGKKIMENIPKVTYSPAGDAHIDYDYYTNADYALVDTENLYDVTAESATPNYRNGNRAEKTNKIILNRIDNRHDPKRTTGSIIIEKTTSSDAHYDFNNLHAHDMGYFRYYYYEGRVRAIKLGSPIRFAFFRDVATANGQINVEPMKIDAAGNVITGSGKIVKKLKKNEWLNFKIIMDTETHIARAYVDDVLVDDNISIGRLTNPTMLRIWVDTGDDCTAEFDKLLLLGMRHDYDPENPDYHPSFWSDDSGLVEWLSEGNKTAFYGYSENVFANGEKHIRVDKPLYGKNYNHILYVSAKALSLGYNFNLSVDAASKSASDEKLTVTAGSKAVTYNGENYELSTECLWENDTVYIPVETFAKTVLKHDVKNETNGLIVTSATPFLLDTYEEMEDYLIQVAGRSGYRDDVSKIKPAKALNWFMSWERPTAATLKADFNAIYGDGTSSDAHPRVIGTKKDFDIIRNNYKTDKNLNKMVNDIVKQADATMGAQPPAYALPDKQRILSQARTALGWFRNLSFAYQITGDEKYAEKCWEILQALLTFPDWNPSHMIDTAELVGGCAIAYDWCYDYWTEEQRQWIFERVKKLGMVPIYNQLMDIQTTRYEWAGANDYAAAKSNFNTVINGSQMVGLTAFADRDPEFCFKALQEAMRSIEYTLLVYRPDGIWMESPGYWEYAASYVTRGLSSVINLTGNHYGFLDSQGLASTGRWLISQNSYNGVNNFHDAGAGKFRPFAMAFFGKFYNDDIVSAVALDYAANQRRAEVEDAIWYVPGITASADDLPLDLYYEGFDTVGSRSSYSDPNGFYYATHGGLVTCYHSQYDVCSFVLDNMGVRWAHDLGSDDYNVRRDQNGFNKMYRDIAESHNLMVYNKQVPGQDKEGGATMLKWESKSLGSIAVYDVTSVYASSVNKATRGFLVGDNRRSLTVRDEFNVKTKMPASWYMCTPADAEIVNNNLVILKSQGKKLKLEIITNADSHTISYGPAQPLPSSPQIMGQNKNEGFYRLGVDMELSPNKDYYCMVKLSPYDEVTTDVKLDDKPCMEWTIPDGDYNLVKRKTIAATICVNGKPVDEIITNGRVGIVEGEPMPTITAENITEGCTYEVFYGEKFGDDTLVRVYSPDKSYWVDYGISYQVSKSTDISAYNVHEVKDVEVSEGPEPENHEMNMFDNNYATRWTSPNDAENSWAIFDLGEVKKIDAIGLAFWRGDTRNYYYDLFVSTDGENWTPVVEGGANSGTSEGMELELIGENARFIKFVGAGNSNNGHSNILEFRALQKK